MPVDQHSLYGMEYVERVPAPAAQERGVVRPWDYIQDENGENITDENDEPLRG